MMWKQIRMWLLLVVVFASLPAFGVAQTQSRTNRTRPKPDPKAEIAKAFDKMAKGKSYIDVRTYSGFLRSMLVDLVRKKGISNGKITKKVFIDYFVELKKSPGGLRFRREITWKDFQSKVKQNIDYNLRRDRNKDGVLDNKEATFSLRKRFKEFDKNGDEKLNREEISRYAFVTMEQRYRVKGGIPNPEGRPLVYHYDNLPEVLSKGWYGLADTDQDGQVGLYEWRKLKRHVSDFLRFDRNRDGFITAQEMLYYFDHVEKLDKLDK